MRHRFEKHQRWTLETFDTEDGASSCNECPIGSGEMVVRFIASSRGSKSQVKSSRDNKSKSHIVQRTNYDGFEIEVVKKQVGMTVRRDVFDATIRREATVRPEVMGQLQAVSNHTTIKSAVEAAKKLVDNQRRQEMSRWEYQQRQKEL